MLLLKVFFIHFEFINFGIFVVLKTFAFVVGLG